MARVPMRAPSRREVLGAGGCGLAAIAIGGRAQAREQIHREDLVVLFDRAEVAGTFVAFDVRPNRITIVHAERAEKRFSPASTFKIPHTLIAFETGVVSSAEDVFHYDGAPRPLKAWQRDMTLREAVATSNVPVFQAIARRLGLGRYRYWIDRLDYGNCTIDEPVDRFWLDGPLEISAEEQVRFLALLAFGQLPASAASQTLVRDLIRIEEKDGRVLFAKSGWSGEIGWWVGWVEEGNKVTTFALNMDMTQMEGAPKRISIGREMLAQLGIY